MDRQHRLRKGPEFDTVYAQGTVIAGPLIVLRVLPNSAGHPRWGFAVGKKLVPGAVGRNRLRRRLREAARLSPASESLDIVITARRGAIDASFRDLSRAVGQGLSRAARSEGGAA